jgi:hypothetical protein
MFSLLFHLLLPWQPLGQYGQVVTQWRHPVASGVALDMLHWAMRFVLHWPTAMAIETTGLIITNNFAIVINLAI